MIRKGKGFYLHTFIVRDGAIQGSKGIASLSHGIKVVVLNPKGNPLELYFKLYLILFLIR